MKTEHMEPAGNAFIVIDRHDVDTMYETAKQLVDTAVKAHMQMFGVDRKTASYWIQRATETAD